MLRSRFVILLGAALAVTTPALAQPASDNDRALAAGHDGLDLYNKGSWGEARARFEEAERLAHSPVFLLYLARCARNAGDLAGAKGAYSRLVKEALPEGTPPPWTAAVEKAKEELSALEKQIAEGSPAATGSASVPVPTGSASVPVPATTGSVPVPAGSASVPVPMGPGAGVDSSPQGSLVPGFVTLGVGIAAVGAGVGLFAHAKSIADGVLARCGDGVCSAADEPQKNTAYDFAHASTGAFVAGGVLGAAGVTLLILRPFGKPSPVKQGVSVQPGLGGIRISGSF